WAAPARATASAARRSKRFIGAVGWGKGGEGRAVYSSLRESGGIGRRARLRIWWPRGRGGSSPPFRTGPGRRKDSRRRAFVFRSGRAARLPGPQPPTR